MFPVTGSELKIDQAVQFPHLNTKDTSLQYLAGICVYEKFCQLLSSYS